MWLIQTTTSFDQWFASLGSDEQAEIIAKVELLKLYGPRLPRPHADTLKQSKYANMKELRADTAASVLRIAFAFDPARNAILLTGGNKGGVNQSRFYKALIERADTLYSRHLEQQREKER